MPRREDVEPGWTVRLRRDLTRYHPALREGLEGRAALPAARSLAFGSTYVRCVFPIGGGDEKEVDVLRSDLDVTDERWKRLEEEEAKALEDALEGHVKAARVLRGPRGGFEKLIVEYSNARPNDEWTRRREAESIMDRLRPRGVLSDPGSEKRR